MTVLWQNASCPCGMYPGYNPQHHTIITIFRNKSIEGEQLSKRKKGLKSLILWRQDEILWHFSELHEGKFNIIDILTQWAEVVLFLATYKPELFGNFFFQSYWFMVLWGLNHGEESYSAILNYKLRHFISKLRS